MEADREYRQSVAASDRTNERLSDNFTSTQRLLQKAETEGCKWPLEMNYEYEVKDDELGDHPPNPYYTY
jgi:hypothetical protein